jgi:hypothetical protein
MGAGLGEQCREVLALERDRGAFGVMLVVAAGRAVGGAGDDRGELPLEFGDLAKGLLTVGIQPRLGGLLLSHLHRLSFGKTIRSAGRTFAPNLPAL